MGYDLWQVFADREAALNIARCPAVLARALGENATRANRKTSEALNSLPDRRLIGAVVEALLAAAGRDALVDWATSASCTTGWLRLAADLSRAVEAREEESLTPEAITADCQATGGIIRGPPDVRQPGGLTPHRPPWLRAPCVW